MNQSQIGHYREFCKVPEGSFGVDRLDINKRCNLVAWDVRVPRAVGRLAGPFAGWSLGPGATFSACPTVCQWVRNITCSVVFY